MSHCVAAAKAMSDEWVRNGIKVDEMVIVLPREEFERLLWHIVKEVNGVASPDTFQIQLGPFLVTTPERYQVRLALQQGLTK